MFEELDTLQAKRQSLHQELAVVNEQIRQQFEAADRRIAELRRTLGVGEMSRVVAKKTPSRH